MMQWMQGATELGGSCHPHFLLGLFINCLAPCSVPVMRFLCLGVADCYQCQRVVKNIVSEYMALVSPGPPGHGFFNLDLTARNQGQWNRDGWVDAMSTTPRIFQHHEKDLDNTILLIALC